MLRFSILGNWLLSRLFSPDMKSLHTRLFHHVPAANMTAVPTFSEGLPAAVHSQQLMECCSRDQDINMLPTQSTSIPWLNQVLRPIPRYANSQNRNTTLIDWLAETKIKIKIIFSNYFSKWIIIETQLMKISPKLSWLHPANIWWYLIVDHSQWLTSA